MERVSKPWGYELILHDGRKDGSNYVVKLLHINTGHRTSLQKHIKKVESWYLLTNAKISMDGLGVKIDDTMFGSGSFLHVPINVIHRVSATDSDVEIVETSTTELDDIVRIEDDYSRY